MNPLDRYPHKKTPLMEELDEMIARGWGTVSRWPTTVPRIPDNWREVEGPYNERRETDIPDRINSMREIRTQVAKKATA